jgi:hypothetical protein
MSPGDVFATLWEQIRNEGNERVDILYGVPKGSGEIDANGLYAPAGTARFQTRPRIMLFRAPGTLPTPLFEPDMTTDPTDEATTLSHEGGHRRSDVEGNRTAAYLAAVKTPNDGWPSMSVDAKRLIYEEEVRAWRYGRERLARLGCDDWAHFDDRERVGLANYRRLLAFNP